MIKSFERRAVLASMLKTMEEDDPKLKIYLKGEFLQEGFETVDKLTPTCVVMRDDGEAVFLGCLLKKMDGYLIQSYDLLAVEAASTEMMFAFEERAAARRINEKYEDRLDEYDIKDSIGFAVCDELGNLTSPNLLDLGDDKCRDLIHHRR